MENASKALLIAAAVLIAIILIAFAVKIFKPTTDVADQTKTIGENLDSSKQGTIGRLALEINRSSAGNGGIEQNGNEYEEYLNSEAGKLENRPKPNIGDRVNYNPGTQTVKSYAEYEGIGEEVVIGEWPTEQYFVQAIQCTPENLIWRVLDINDLGEIELISEEATSTKLAIKGRDCYREELDELISKLYGNGRGAKNARSIKISDISKLTSTLQIDTPTWTSDFKYVMNETSYNVTRSEFHNLWNKSDYYECYAEVITKNDHSSNKIGDVACTYIDVHYLPYSLRPIVTLNASTEFEKVSDGVWNIK